MRQFRVMLTPEAKAKLDAIRADGNFPDNATALEYILTHMELPEPEYCSLCLQWTETDADGICEKKTCQDLFGRQDA